MIWREIPVRALFMRRNQTGQPELPLLSVYRDLGVVPRTGRDDNFNRPGDDLTTYRVVLPGDLVLNKMKTWQGSLGISNYEGLVSPAYFVAEPRSAENPRFLHYLLRSLPLIAQYAARSKGIRPAQWDLSWEAFSSIRISLPPKQCQAAIAIFLDVETARIDTLIAKKCQMIDLLSLRFWASLDNMSSSVKSDRIPLRRALSSIVDGPFGSAFSSGDYTLSGAAVVRLGNIGFAEYRHDNQAHIPMSLFERFLRHRAFKGDLLIAGLGDDSNHAGRACVSPDLGDAIVKGKCFSARVVQSRASVRYLAYILSSPTGAKAVGLSARGSTRSMINLDIIKSTIIPLPSVEVQRSIADLADMARLRADRIIDALERQISLLRERRQALITAAVTGEIDVPGVST